MEQSMLIYMIGVLILVTSCVVIYYKVVRDQEGYHGMIILLVTYAIIMSAFAYAYPHCTNEYKNGYNDYPNDTLYIQTKAVEHESLIITTSSWYCDGWEDARERNITRSIVHKISQEAAA